MASKSKRNETIEGLRGLAAWLVVFSHINGMSVEGGFAPGWQRWIDANFNHLGIFGVCAFFSISGYLILQSLLKYRDVKVFAVNRAKRIYPLFMVLHLVMFIVGPLVAYDWMKSLRHNPVDWVTHFTSNLLFLPGVFDLPIAQKNAWSLSFEAAFYIISCLLFLGWYSTKSTRYLWGALGVGTAAAMLLTRPYSWFFVVGVAAFFFLERRSEVPKWLRAAPVSLLLIILTYVFLPLDGKHSGFRLDTLWLWPICLAFGFLMFLTLVKELGWLSRILRTKFLTYLGLISYSLYLVHPFVLDPLRKVASRIAHGEPSTVAAVFFLVFGLTLPILLAHFTYHFVEVKLTKALFSRKPEPTLETKAAQA